MMARGRDTSGRFAAKSREVLSPAYRARLERAERKGLSLGAARGHGIAAQKAWQSRGALEREQYRRALDVLSRMRHGESLYGASRAVHTTPDSVQRYVGGALARDRRGRYVAKPTDRFYRRMKWLNGRGLDWVEPANSREASKLAAYWAAVARYVTTGDDRALRRFRSMRLRTRTKLSLPFLTDLAALDRLARAGELSFEDLYELAA
jgi:hypothetical protein